MLGRGRLHSNSPKGSAAARLGKRASQMALAPVKKMVLEQSGNCSDTGAIPSRNRNRDRTKPSTSRMAGQSLGTAPQPPSSLAQKQHADAVQGDGSSIPLGTAVVEGRGAGNGRQAPISVPMISGLSKQVSFEILIDSIRRRRMIIIIIAMMTTMMIFL